MSVNLEPGKDLPLAATYRGHRSCRRRTSSSGSTTVVCCGVCVWFWSAARRAALAALGLSTTVLWRWCCQYRDAAPVNAPRPISPVVAITSADQPRLSPTACAATAPAAARLATTRVWPGSSSAHSAACRCFLAARLVRSQDGTTLAVSAAPVATTPREAAPARSL